ncbi:MAG: hypothetical protein A2700_02890 [Candidatus Blackburnbacteria bacterium RIFCSPHIGHO2_01_FULL_44_64]|uniref:DUF5666 domain-containing protein n=1 Tax=Candidatus Blackburnbacteria bacterium RIFCSPHIGHO2_02_FULL_44_20 TaxID=1797516 RepID=A0A1G1V7Q4_9BACT|nr:MAG: hypothetical protein A2700_02890 [Candidatus Blackburnbacteria bacterium RIFCSPHIGHO2_01_FULL_44_64]OGY11182.1 MAG: hypothetical protein A3E16_00260 [Candidatus Blackburnbacteria bacterium RIFCSPHIGHO2_12_FULL_44_25]OGY11469.1 MAG: hypothetical protein A3D26_04570 [Candidatus Blackburnbacteria bacterium RIFCSPHIGHO2_02_FULL_44_20]OGY14316.1 MAG: hypothetical protein A3A62_00850 [Candidatus Blackburnbacteria bacterium RIFCSPLOWO2_01_FULL_44_43]OGY17011.1 MAG: hypothetical protein A3H88_0
MEENNKKQQAVRLVIVVVLAVILSLIAYRLSPPANAQEDATPSVRDLVREKVKEKLDTLTKKPTGVVGTLQQITDKTLEIKTISNKIQLVSTDEETKFLQVIKGKSKEIKFEELSLDQYIVAMGYKNGKDVIEVKRIVIYDQSPIGIVRNSFFGKVTKAEKNSLTFETLNKESQTVKTTSKTTTTAKDKKSGEQITLQFSDIKADDRIIAIGKTNENGSFETTRIHVLSEKTPSAKPTLAPKTPAKPTPTPLEANP